MENIVKLKHWVKKEVYFVVQESIPHYHDCSICEGEGVLLSKGGRPSTCTGCNGEKKVTTGGSIEHKVKSGIIDLITIEVNKDESFSADYYVDNKEMERHTRWFSGDKLFDTKEEAEATVPKGFIAGYTK